MVSMICAADCSVSSKNLDNLSQHTSVRDLDNDHTAISGTNQFEHVDYQRPLPNTTTLMNQLIVPHTNLPIRNFQCLAKILGNDTNLHPVCTLDHTLCDLCASFILRCLERELEGELLHEVLSKEPYLPHYSTRRKLVASATAGCQLCNAILDCSNTNDDDIVSFSLRQYNDTFSIFALTPNTVDYEAALVGTFDFVLAQDTEECLKVPRRNQSCILKYPTKSSNECFTQIDKWYKDCMSQHVDCERQRLPMPTRLLDLDRIDEDSVRLIEPERSACLEYVALSYCWGEQTSLMTSKANISDMMKGIALELLPSVVQDAIAVCLTHGFRYLWVDRLCICQDDENDWETEAKNLANIFGGCVFTISALSSSSVDQPFLVGRQSAPIAIGMAEVLYGHRSEFCTLYLRNQPRSLDDEIQSSQWIQRGWTFQERVLAPAVLHFGHDQMMWECGTCHLRSETGQISNDHELVIRLTDKLVFSDESGTKPLWSSIIESFSKRRFTFDRDRLLALAGISAKLRKERFYEGSYVAGLWEDSLESQLVWTTQTQKALKSTKVDHRFPTWSWLHLHTKITLNPVSALTSGLFESPIFIFDNPEEKTKSVDETVVYKCSIKVSGFIQQITKRAITMDSQRDTRKTYLNTHIGLPGKDSSLDLDRELTDPGPFYALRILERMKYDDLLSDHSSSIYYLLLREVSFIEGGIPQFERIGLLTLHGMSEMHFSTPFPDVECRNGRPLLTMGGWTDAILV